jgi:hypothetical protein
VYYDLGLGNIATAFQNVYPYYASTRNCCNIQLPVDEGMRIPPTPGVDAPQQFFLLDPGLRMPYTVEWNTAWEQSLGSEQAVTLSYLGAAGRRLLVEQDYIGQHLVEWPTSNTGLNIQRNLGRSRYDALQCQYRVRLIRGTQVLASYTFARAKDNTSRDSVVTTAPSSLGMWAQEFGPSDFDVRHNVSVAVTYDVSTGWGPSALRPVVRDWGVDVLIRMNTAVPVSPQAGFAAMDNGAYFYRRADGVSGQLLYLNDASFPGGRRINPAAFMQPSAGRQGTFPRNGLRGLPASQVDVALRRQLARWNRARLQMRAELFNALNHPNFASPNNDISDGMFGRSTQMLNRALSGLNALYQMGGPRSGQLAVKLEF